MKHILLVILLLCLLSGARAQDYHKVDSLRRLLSTALHDTTRIAITFELSKEYLDNEPDKAMEYARQMLDASEKINYITGLGDAYSVLGYASSGKGNNAQALEYYKKSLFFRKQQNNKSKISAALGNIGLLYTTIGDNNQALTYQLASLKINEELRDTAALAGTYHNLGQLYSSLGNEEENFKCLLKALAMNRRVGNKEWEAINLHNISAYYRLMGQNDIAFRYRDSVRTLYRQIGNKSGIARSYVTLGYDLFTAGKHTEGIDSTLIGLSLYREIGDSNGIAMTYDYLGLYHTELRHFEQAEMYLTKALEMNKAGHNLKGISDIYFRLSNLESARGRYAQSLEYFKRFISARDSLTNNDNRNTMMKQTIQYEFSKKEEQAKAEQEKKDAVQTITRNALIAGIVLMLILAIILYNRFRIKKIANRALEEKNQLIVREKANVEREKANVEHEKQRSDSLLLNILPAEVAEELKEKGAADAKQFDEVTVMFTDFKGFTRISERLSPAELVTEIDTCFKAFDTIITKYSVEKIKTIGDSYMCVGGLPKANATHAHDVVRAALEMQEFMNTHLSERLASGKEPFEMRIGIHSGSVVAGIVGLKKFAYDIWGDTVNIASRMESSGEEGKINISGATYELIKNQFTCVYRGKIDAKNKGEIDMYFVEKEC
ncbi:MAG: adenylate/guanylate cyclase domain-containing protein [Candidatus Kapaibacterium sp.]